MKYRQVLEEDSEEITDFESNSNFSKSDGDSDKDLWPQSVAVASTKIKSSTLLKKQKVERKQNKRVRRKSVPENIEDEKLDNLKSFSQKVTSKVKSRVNFTIFGECIVSKLCKLEGTLINDEMDFAEFELLASEEARKFSQRKQSHSDFPFLHSTLVSQQTHTSSNTGSKLLVPLSLIHLFIRISMCCLSFLYIAYDYK